MNHMHSLRFSVVIPTYNGQLFIAETIESVLRQTYPWIEILVVDDGSTDQTMDIVKKYPSVNLIRQANQGNATARNRGIQASNGECIALLDQDDLFVEDKIAAFADLFESRPELDYANALTIRFLMPGIERPVWQRPEILDNPLPDHSPGSMVFRRRAFDRIGLFNPALLTSNDTEWVSRARDAKLQTDRINRVLLHRRIHGDNQSSQVSLQHKELLQIIGSKLAARKEI